MKKGKKQYKMVVVTWRDAVHSFGWQDNEEPEFDEDTCKSVGWLLKRDKKFVTLAQTVGMDNANAQLIQIPSGMIEKVEELDLRIQDEPCN